MTSASGTSTSAIGRPSAPTISGVARATRNRLGTTSVIVAIAGIIIIPPSIYLVPAVRGSGSSLLDAVTAGLGLTGLGLAVASAWLTGRMFDMDLWEALTTRVGDRTKLICGSLLGGLARVWIVVGSLGVVAGTAATVGAVGSDSAPGLGTILATTMLRPLVASAGWLMLGVGVAMLTRSAATAVAVTSGWLLFLEPAIRQIDGTGTALPAVNLQLLGVDIDPQTVSVAFLWCLGLIGIGTWMFTRRDLT